MPEVRRNRVVAGGEGGSERLQVRWGRGREAGLSKTGTGIKQPYSGFYFWLSKQRGTLKTFQPSSDLTQAMRCFRNSLMVSYLMGAFLCFFFFFK